MKKILSIIIITILILPSVTLAKFNDINSNTTYYKAIDWMADNGVIEGYEDGNFGPDICVKRVELLKMLFITSQQELSSNDDLTNNYFSDTKTTEWYWPYLKTAIENKFVEGYTDGTFKPGQCVNRAEAMKLAFKQFNISTEIPDSGGFAFTDLPNGEWYTEYIGAAIIRNIAPLEHVRLDYDNLLFDQPQRLYLPSESMSRKEVAELLYRTKTIIDNDKFGYSIENNTQLKPNDLQQRGYYPVRDNRF